MIYIIVIFCLFDFFTYQDAKMTNNLLLKYLFCIYFVNSNFTVISDALQVTCYK